MGMIMWWVDVFRESSQCTSWALAALSGQTRKEYLRTAPRSMGAALHFKRSQTFYHYTTFPCDMRSGDGSRWSILLGGALTNAVSIVTSPTFN